MLSDEKEQASRRAFQPTLRSVGCECDGVEPGSLELLPPIRDHVQPGGIAQSGFPHHLITHQQTSSTQRDALYQY